jgi:hypothetical protein
LLLAQEQPVVANSYSGRKAVSEIDYDSAAATCNEPAPHEGRRIGRRRAMERAINPIHECGQPKLARTG